MTRYFCVLSVLSVVSLSYSSTYAQGLSLKDRSTLEVNIGVWGGSNVSSTIGVGGVQSTANTSSFVGNFVYAYSLRENLAVTLSAGVLSAGASVNAGILGASQEAGTVIPLLIGVRYYVPSPEHGEKVRPFLSLGVGTYLGFEASSSVGLTVVQETQSESAFGSRIGAGIDFYVSDSFKFVANAGYNIMTDFSAPVTGRTNFNGGDFSVGAGFVF